MTTSKIETLTDADREYLADCNHRDRGPRAIRIIDAHAAERAALTEQVAQLTAALENIALGTVHPAEREVARLTEALAAAELTRDALKHQCGKHLDVRCDLRERAEAAERDRDAANALLRRGPGFMRGDDSWPAWCEEVLAHLSSQPAAPAPTAAESRVRELEAENTTLRVNNRVLEADNADLLDRRRAAESDLAALREQVARAIEYLEQHGSPFACVSAAHWRFSVAADTKLEAALGLGVWHGEGYYKALDLDGLRALLAAQGLHVVTAADKAVLDAADAWLDEGTCAIRALADAVRARRGVK